MIDHNNIINIIKKKNQNAARESIIEKCSMDKKYMYYYLALTYCTEQKFDLAILFFNTAINSGLKSSILYYNLGTAYIEKKDFDKASICFKTAIGFDEMYYKSYLNLAYSLLKKGDIKCAYRTVKLCSALCSSKEADEIENKLMKIILNSK